MKDCTMSMVEGTVPVGRPRKTLRNSVTANLSLTGFDPWDAQDCGARRKATGRKVNPAEPGNIAFK